MSALLPATPSAPAIMDGHGQYLSPIDSSFLRLETPQAQMHIGWSAIFSLPDGVRRPTIGALRARAAARLHLVPRCRQRLSASPLGRLGEPRWVDDLRFDIADHVVAVTLPTEIVSWDRFARLRDALLGEQLDRGRPLWQMALIPRLPDGRVGIIGRVHHAMADGVSAMKVAALLLDAGIDGQQPQAWSGRDAPGTLRWASDSVAGAGQMTRRAVITGARTITQPRSTVREALHGAGQIALALQQDTLARAPHSMLNGQNSARRTLTGCRIPLEHLRAAKAEDGGTLNDVALATVAGALRRLALFLNQPTVPLKAMIPVSVRRPHEYAELGNRISQVMVWLPLHLQTPAARLAWVREQTERFKQTQRPQGQRHLLSAMGLIQGPARQVLLRAMASPRAYNLVVSNVRGPETPLHMLGARLQEMQPVVPIGHGHALAIGMFSHDGDLHVGLHSDPDALLETALLPELLRDEVDALSAPERKRPARERAFHTGLLAATSRGARIRTGDLADPNGARYQAAPRPDEASEVSHIAPLSGPRPPRP
jgi:diacylglycerol O-acyltransferase